MTALNLPVAGLLTVIVSKASAFFVLEAFLFFVERMVLYGNKAFSQAEFCDCGLPDIFVSTDRLCL